MSEEEETLIADMIRQFRETLECGECAKLLQLDQESPEDYYFSCPECKLKIRVNKVKLRVRMFELLKVVYDD